MASRRGYVAQDELAEFADITVTDSGEADDQISQAEELIDSFVGSQDKFIKRDYIGQVSSVSGAVITDANATSQLNLTDDFFKGCELEIISGTGAGQRKVISSSDKDDRSVTLVAAFSTAPDTTSHFRIYQLGKFPRAKDVFYSPDGTKVLKSIPEAVKRATAAQVEFFINQGAKFFGSDKADIVSEKIGNYGYEKAGAGSGSGGLPSYAKLIAPKARAFLRGIRIITGRLR